MNQSKLSISRAQEALQFLTSLKIYALSISAGTPISLTELSVGIVSAA